MRTAGQCRSCGNANYSIYMCVCVFGKNGNNEKIPKKNNNSLLASAVPAYIAPTPSRRQRKKLESSHRCAAFIVNWQLLHVFHGSIFSANLPHWLPYTRPVCFLYAFAVAMHLNELLVATAACTPYMYACTIYCCSCGSWLGSCPLLYALLPQCILAWHIPITLPLTTLLTEFLSYHLRFLLPPQFINVCPYVLRCAVFC